MAGLYSGLLGLVIYPVASGGISDSVLKMVSGWVLVAVWVIVMMRMDADGSPRIGSPNGLWSL